MEKLESISHRSLTFTKTRMHRSYAWGDLLFGVCSLGGLVLGMGGSALGGGLVMGGSGLGGAIPPCTEADSPPCGQNS